MPKVAFSIFIESCKLIGNICKTKFVCSLLVGTILSIVRLLNRVCVIVEHSHVFSLQAEEKDLSPAALVAGFTRSLHRVMISLIIHFLASESCLILAKMSSKQVTNSPSFINVMYFFCKRQTWFTKVKNK